jgi:putative membrane protein
MGSSAVVASARRAVKPWPILAGLAGAALAAFLLVQSGVRPVVSLMGHAGFGIAVVIAFHFSQLWLTAAGWQSVIRPGPKVPSRVVLTVLRLIREGVNNLLPVAQIGGSVVSARLLTRRGIPAADAAASSIVDLSVEVMTQAIFTCLGIVMLVAILGAGTLAWPLLAGLAAFLAMAAALVGAQWFGLARLAERAAARFGWTEPMAGLHEAIIATYRRRSRLLRACCYHMLAWMLGAVEICLTLHFLGRDVGLAQGFIIESLGQTIRSVGFAIPGALGVQEGGYVLLCGLFGVGPDLALALSLVKRLRDLVLGAPSIALWLRFERDDRTPRPAPG